MAELAFRFGRKITRADWLLNSPIVYDVGPVQYAFYSGPVSFGGKIFHLFSMKFRKIKDLQWKIPNN